MTGIEVREDYLKNDTEERERRGMEKGTKAAKRIILMVRRKAKKTESVSGHIQTTLKPFS